MATAREVIRSALRKILAYGDTEEPSAQELSDGLEMLNDFMESLAVSGVTVAHQTLTLDDELNVDKAHIRAIKHQLALELAPEFGATVDPQVAFIAREGMKSFESDTRVRRPVPVDDALRRNLWQWRR